jgi:serine/threonine protein kinase
MPSTLGKYTLLSTLGRGAHSKVKLAMNTKTREYYAVKILKKQNKNIDQKFMDLVITEVQALSVLHHPNIVNMIEFSNEGTVVKQNGTSYPVIFIVLELATGGEFFDYIATGGRFPENIARFYFRQLIEALYYVHKKGATHRDLKPENLLFDQSYNLKVADFGFAAPIQGRDGSGSLKTKLGTESYMAPEINLKKPYNGASVDLFACGIILFIMVTQHPPFTKAIPDDPYYKLICLNKEDIFWKAHARNKPNGEAFFSEEFKDLINSML